MNKTFLIILYSIIMQLKVFAQGKAEVELYNYLHATPNIQALFHIQSASNWYAELRYNYEDAKTFSLYGGKTFEKDNARVTYEITPLIGFSTGRFTGISPAFNTYAEFKDFFFSSQTQYSIATKKNIESFFFSWSELGYNAGDYFYTGLAMQYTAQKNQNDFEPGFMAGFHWNDTVYIPFYVFSPFRSDRYFILGLTYEFSLKRKNEITTTY